MTPSSRPNPFHVPPPDRPVLADQAPMPGLDGVVGDVLVTVLLAGAVAALVGAVLFLLWRALGGV